MSNFKDWQQNEYYRSEERKPSQCSEFLVILGMSIIGELTAPTQIPLCPEHYSMRLWKMVTL